MDQQAKETPELATQKDIMVLAKAVESLAQVQHEFLEVNADAFGVISRVLRLNRAIDQAGDAARGVLEAGWRR